MRNVGAPRASAAKYRIVPCSLEELGLRYRSTIATAKALTTALLYFASTILPPSNYVCSGMQHGDSAGSKTAERRVEGLPEKRHGMSLAVPMVIDNAL